MSHGGIDRKVRTAFLKFHRGGGDAGLEFRDRLRKNASETWTESIREERCGEKKIEEKKGRRIEKKIAAVKNNEDVLESDRNNVCGTFSTEIVMSERNDIGRGIEESP